MLNIHNLTVSFGGEDLFSKITFKLEKGNRVGLVGKNGAGKSTMMKILTGFIKPNSGEVFVDEIDVLKKELYLIKVYYANPAISTIKLDALIRA